MGLFAPIFLLALPLLGLIIALYLLKLRRPTAPVGSLHLWESLTRDREANSLWQRLRVSLLLILQLLALLALIIALARPWVTSEEAVAPNAIIIIDVSASSGASDGEPRTRKTRLQIAQNRATDIVDDMPQGGTATLIVADDQATVLVPTTDDKARLRAAIEGLTPQPTQTDMLSALKVAGAIAAREPHSVVWVLSDGAFPSAAEQTDPIPATIRYVQLGTTGANGAITALTLEQKGASLSLFVQLLNSGSVTMTRRLELTVDEQPWNARTLALPPQASHELIVEDVPLGARVIRARLAGPDALEVDNEAWTVNRASAPGNVLLVSNGNRFLELALSLLPTVTLYRVAPTDYDPASTVNNAPLDLTIFDADVLTSTLAALPDGNLLVFAPQPENPMVEVTGVITEPVPVLTSVFDLNSPSGATQRGADPLLRFVDLSSLRVARASRMLLPKWGRVVLNSDQGPLIVAGEDAGRKVVLVAFDVRDTDLPLQTAFPLLMRNVVTYLLPDPSGGLPVSVSPRTAVSIEAVGPEVNRMLVEDPYGREWVHDISPERPRVSYAETNHLGVYYITQYSGEQIVAQEAFAVNLFSRDESRIAPNPAPGLPRGEAAAPAAGRSTQTEEGLFRRELWPAVAMMGFFLLVLEWLYAQRMAIRRTITEMQTRRGARRADL